MITFPVKSIDNNLVSLVAALSVLIFTEFVVIRLSAPIFIVELPTSLKTFLLKNDLQYCFLILCAMMWNDKQYAFNLYVFVFRCYVS